MKFSVSGNLPELFIQLGKKKITVSLAGGIKKTNKILCGV